jgi:hypothetical protein
VPLNRPPGHGALGADLVSAMQAGRWKNSAMVARYSARLLAKRGGMAQIADRVVTHE